MKPPNGTLDHGAELPARGHAATTVLVAVGSAQVREGLVAMLGALDCFRVVAEADTDDAALEAARTKRPHLALVEPELSNCGGWWVMQQMRAEHLVGVVVALGRRADSGCAQIVGAQSYVQMGTSPRDLLRALETAIANRVTNGSVAQTERDLLSDAHSVI